MKKEIKDFNVTNSEDINNFIEKKYSSNQGFTFEQLIRDLQNEIHMVLSPVHQIHIKRALNDLIIEGDLTMGDGKKYYILDSVNDSVKDAMYGTVSIEVSSANDISLSTIVSAVKKEVGRYSNKLAKIYDLRVDKSGYGAKQYRDTVYAEIAFSEYSDFHDHQLKASAISLAFKLKMSKDWLYGKYKEETKEQFYRELGQLRNQVIAKLKQYEGKVLYEDKSRKFDSLKDAQIKDSIASEFVARVKATYPQIKVVKQLAKSGSEYHITKLYFDNVPGQDYSGFDNDPRTKVGKNVEKFMEHTLTTLGVPSGLRDVNRKYGFSNVSVQSSTPCVVIYEELSKRKDSLKSYIVNGQKVKGVDFTDAIKKVKDASRKDVIQQLELAIKKLNSKDDNVALEYLEDSVKIIKMGLRDSIKTK